MKQLRTAIIMFLLMPMLSLYAQNIDIQGIVTDAHSEPIIGASIKVEGTTLGAVTDIDGRFSLQAPQGSNLTVSYIGFQTKTVKANSRNLTIMLNEDSQTLDEVVLVGTVMKKSDLTGAVVGVDAKTLKERPVNNVNEALQGKVAGVFISTPSRPTDDASIRIRGINTINGSTDPIYVVDGLVMDNSYSGFSSINLNDVASIEVLKDASATALYGSRGSNGVVVITTKKGQKGEGKVNYDGWIGFETYANTPKTMGTKDLFELRKEAYVNGFKQTNPTGDVNDYINNVVMGSNKVFANYELEAYKNNTNSNWLDAVDRTGFQQNHMVSFSNGSDKGNYYLSAGFMDNKGMIKKSESRKYTARINADQYIKSWLRVGTNTSFTRTEHSIVSDGILHRARLANPMLAVDEDLPTLNWQDVFDQNNFNPIRSLQTDNNLKYNRLLSANFININPIKGLNLRTSFSIDYAYKQQNIYTPTTIYESERYGTQGEANDNRDSRIVWQWDNSISYETRLGLHRLNGMFGTSASRTNFSYLNASARGFGTDLFTYHNLGAGYKKDQRGLGSGWTANTLQSYIVRLNWDYADKYMVTATARYDGSSKFAKGHRWGLFPSFSAAWNVVEEDFMKSQDIFSQLKARIGYGVVGNQNIADYSYLSLYNASYTGTVDKGYTNSFVSNGRRGTPGIKWEKQRQFNIGVDMGWLDNRIRLSADFFYIKNKDLLMSHSLPTTSGYKTTIENVGAIENKGIEFALGAEIIKTHDLQWNFNATLSKDKNKVTELYGSTGVVYNVDGDRNIQNTGNLFIGESRNTLYMWRTGGIAQAGDMDRLSKINFNGYNVNPGDLYPLDVNGDKEIDQNDRVVIGSTDPKFYGGFSSDVTYKGWSLNAVFNYSCGAKALSPWYTSLITSVGTSVASTDLKDRWSETNTGARFPRVLAGFDYNHYNAGQMDFCVQKASYLRLSALTFSYTFQKNITDKLHLSNLRFYFTGSNLFCVTNYKGYDPETGDWYPPTRMYTFGMNISF